MLGLRAAAKRDKHGFAVKQCKHYLVQRGRGYFFADWWWPEKYADSYKAIVNVGKSQIKGFEVVEQYL